MISIVSSSDITYFYSKAEKHPLFKRACKMTESSFKDSNTKKGPDNFYFKLGVMANLSFLEAMKYIKKEGLGTHNPCYQRLTFLNEAYKIMLYNEYGYGEEDMLDCLTEVMGSISDLEIYYSYQDNLLTGE